MRKMIMIIAAVAVIATGCAKQEPTGVDWVQVNACIEAHTPKDGELRSNFVKRPSPTEIRSRCMGRIYP